MKWISMALLGSCLAGCVQPLLPGETQARDPNDPGRRMLSEFVGRSSKLSEDQRQALFKESYAGKTLEITAQKDAQLTASIAFAVPPEQFLVWATFAESDNTRAMEIPKGRFVRIRGTMVETLQANSVSLDRATVLAVY